MINDEKIIFVESEFQSELASLIDQKYIYYTRNYSLVVLIFFVLSRFCFHYIFNNIRIFISADHRSFATLFLSNIKSIFPIRHYIIEDGLHSIMVDLYKDKYLYWNCSFIKKQLLKYFLHTILHTDRIKLLEAYTKKLLIPSNDKIYLFFIDQPGLTSFHDCDKLIKFCKVNRIVFKFVKHPRNNQINISFPLWEKPSDQIFIKNSIIVGYASSILYFCNKININNYILNINTSEPYIIGIQQLLLSSGSQKINKLFNKYESI